MATSSPLTPQLLRKLKTVSLASKNFINACKRALDGVVALPDVPQPQSQGESQSQRKSQGDGNNAEDVGLTEEELRAWREASEPLRNLLPEDMVYFIPYTLLNNSSDNILDQSSATTLLAQINAINLALTLEMFLPTSIRSKYPMLTTQIPFIDATSSANRASLVASSQAQEHPSFNLTTSQRAYSAFGNSQPASSQQMTKDQQVESLTLPLEELKSVYLRLCAGRKEKHMLYVLRRVILEICCISIITCTKARGLKTFKPQDLLDTFRVAFLRDPALSGSDVDGGVFPTEEIQEKACKLWDKWAGDVMHRFQTPLNAQYAYTWDSLADTLLTDLLRHVLPPVIEKLDLEGKKKVTVTAAGKTTGTSVRPIESRTITDSQAGRGTIADPLPKSNPPRANLPAPALAHPEGTVDSRFFMGSAKGLVKEPGIAGRSTARILSKPVTTAFATTTASKTIPSTSAPNATSFIGAPRSSPGSVNTPAPPPNLDQDEFGPRLVNPTNKGSVVLPDTGRTVIQAPGTAVHEFDMMEYVQDFEHDGADFGNDGGEFGNDNGGTVDDGDQDDLQTSYTAAVARFGREPYLPAPKFGFTRVPENFRFNAPQRNAVKAVMTPSPESEKGVPSYPPKGAQNAAKSTLNRIRAIVNSDRGRGKTPADTAGINEVDGDEGDNATGAKSKRGRKRKQDTDDEEYEEADGQRAKKRKRESGKAMPPPARVPAKPTAISTAARPSVESTTTTLADPQPHAARHSSASPSTLFNPSEMASPLSSRGGTTAIRAVPPSVRRNVVMADTDSSDDEGPLCRRKTTTSTTATTTSKKVAPPAKSTTTTGVKTKSTPASTRTEATFITANSTSATAVAVQPKRREPVPLPITDALMKSSKQRLSEIKEINEKNKRMYAAFLGEDEDTAATEDSGHNSDELRKFRERREREARGELLVDDALEKSRSKLEDLKRRSKEFEKLPVRRRAKKELVGSLDEDGDASEESEEKERVDVPRPRGRPRKNAVKQVRRPREYKYAVGGNEYGRRKWTEEEDRTLLFALEAAFYEGDLLRPWRKIRDQHGPDGTESTELAGRSVVQMKDRARAIAEKLVRQGKKRPEYLAWISVSEKRITKQK